ncbi:hypothetical protein, partial [Stieleria sp.]|uniref:glycoside hydrolase family 78 protein n=1 Tax=Stieleria sp. TaxID=2795976 RepID=UPI0035645463
MKSFATYTASLLVAVCVATPVSAIEAVHLRCEYVENPVGIDITKPRLSWQVTSKRRGQSQSAYRVIVSTTPENLAGDIGDLWDSGKVVS